MGVGTPEDIVEAVRYGLICLIVFFQQKMLGMDNCLPLKGNKY
ncbi:MAG: hypothetical protein Ct9H90mP22_8570 [Gammaproteobacteria bacterium]|nr:MAG: hypothetical protein Ct9H90mP22_8570 [Gammaproteobacteria bacterium]